MRRGRPDAVHQYRVAARRLRSVLQAFEPLVDEVWARSLRAELGWIASVLSQARDREVLEERFTDAIRLLPTDVDGAAAEATITDGSGAVRVMKLSVGEVGSGAAVELDGTNIKAGQRVILRGGIIQHAR